MKEFKHGTTTGYRYHKCRCEDCTTAARESTKRWIDSNRGKFNETRRSKYVRKRPLQPEHGISGYKKGCRCEVCKTENKINVDRWKATHPDNVQRHKNQRINKVREKIEWLRQIKMDIGCVDCGFNEHPAALHFDHLRDKKFNICNTSGPLDFNLLWEEIEKCEVVCANCHAIRTYQRREI